MEMTFEGTKDFEAFYKAEAWLKEHGYHNGPMQRDDEIGISKEDWIGCYKWRNLYLEGKAALDGIINRCEKRFGPVSLTIYDADDPNPYKAALDAANAKSETMMKGE